jgi:hypothetical protein
VHLDEEQVQRLLHGVLPSQAAGDARAHVAVCIDCRRRLAEAERQEDEVHALLRAVDDPVPPRISAEAVAARAQQAGAAAGARVGDLSWLRRAAAILVVVGIAGAAYAVPGSPVRKWVHAIVEKMGGRPGPTPGPAPGESPAIGAGISVLPEQKLLILFKSAEGDGQVFVSLTDEPEVQVHAPTGAAGFTSSADQLLIDVQDPSATFEVEIPRSAPWVEIQTGKGRVFLKEGERVTTKGSKDAVGGYLFRLAPSGK